MIRPASALRLLLIMLVPGAIATTLHAQVQVDVSLKRTLYVVYEPVLLTVTITNLSGRELDLRDVPPNKWFNLQVDTIDGRPIPPSEGTFSNEPLALGPGQRISRTVNVTPLFPVSEFGAYRIRATVFIAQINKFVSSPPLSFEVTEGREMWQKTVGVPDGQPGAGSMRTVTILSHRLPQSTQLYIRIEDKEKGVVFCTHQLGRLLTFGPPNILLDANNNVHILQNAAPKVFIYTRVGLNGEVLERKSLNEITSRPTLRRGSDGSVLVAGGQVYDPSAPPPEATLPTLNDRPVPFPGSVPKATPEDKRPENLLSR
jgi:hypothetical protein